MAGTGEPDLQELYRFLAMIEKPLLNHFHEGLGGGDFAEWMIDGFRRSTYRQIRDQGAETMKAILLSYPPLAHELAGKDIQLDQFIKEFVEYDDSGEGEDEPDEGEDGGRPRRRPVPVS